jgi:hypothetical protein
MLAIQAWRLIIWIRSAKIVAIMASLMTALASCYSDPISFEGLKPGEMQPAQALIAKSFDAVCVLTPYQKRLDNDAPYRDRVNAHLAETGYRGDEGDWAIVLVRRADVEVLHFRRSADLDILQMPKAKSAQAPKLPEHFQPMSCVCGEAAAFAKIEMKDRTYIILGKSVE